METNNNIIEILRANRNKVIERYERTHKGISLKDYMNLVIWWFGKHPVIARKVIKAERYEVISRINEACDVADRKANAAWDRMVLKDHITSLGGGSAYWAKNFE